MNNILGKKVHPRPASFRGLLRSSIPIIQNLHEVDKLVGIDYYTIPVIARGHVIRFNIQDAIEEQLNTLNQTVFDPNHV
jgi:hypothetical protein